MTQHESASPIALSHPVANSPARVWLYLELILLFGLVPLVLMERLIPVHPLAVGAAIAAVCLLALVRDPAFDVRQLWNRQDLARRVVDLLPLWLVSSVLLTAVLWVLSPDRLFSLVLSQPLTWVTILIAYPLISVYPQEVIYRAFFFHRYKPIAGDGWGMIMLSAAAFAWMHILFANWIAVALCAVGGILFSYRYRTTRSLLVTSIEHVLYGLLIFTVGLGEFIESGSMAVVKP